MRVTTILAGILSCGIHCVQSATSSSSAAAAPTNPSTCPSQLTPERIDTHTHFVPDFYRSAALAANFSHPDGFPGIPAWTEAAHLAWMASANIAKSIISLSTPGVYLIPGNYMAARSLARQVNEFAADLKRRRPDQFGFFASLTLPDIEGSLAEIAYALDHLNADGVVVYSNAEGVYLGDASLDPVFAELNRRNARVFVHPTSPFIGNASKGGWYNIQSSLPQPAYGAPIMEFLFDTTRAVFNMFLTGFIFSVPNIKFIIAHGGGAISNLLERVIVLGSLVLGIPPTTLNTDIVRSVFAKQFYFDLAGAPFQAQIYGLLRYADPSQLTYGSDWPFTPTPVALSLETEMDSAMPNLFPWNVTRAEVYYGNAEALLART